MNMPWTIWILAENGQSCGIPQVSTRYGIIWSLWLARPIPKNGGNLFQFAKWCWNKHIKSNHDKRIIKLSTKERNIMWWYNQKEQKQIGHPRVRLIYPAEGMARGHLLARLWKSSKRNELLDRNVISLFWSQGKQWFSPPFLWVQPHLPTILFGETPQTPLFVGWTVLPGRSKRPCTLLSAVTFHLQSTKWLLVAWESRIWANFGIFTLTNPHKHTHTYTHTPTHTHIYIYICICICIRKRIRICICICICICISISIYVYSTSSIWSRYILCHNLSPLMLCIAHPLDALAPVSGLSAHVARFGSVAAGASHSCGRRSTWGQCPRTLGLSMARWAFVKKVSKNVFKKKNNNNIIYIYI